MTAKGYGNSCADSVFLLALYRAQAHDLVRQLHEAWAEIDRLTQVLRVLMDRNSTEEQQEASLH